MRGCCCAGPWCSPSQSTRTGVEEIWARPWYIQEDLSGGAGVC